jgi:hypothetical protein
MFYYTINKQITNIYDGQPLRVVGNVAVYNDETKEQELTQIPFSEIGVNLSVSDCPTTSKVDFDSFIDQEALTAIEQPYIQNKLIEVQTLYNLGLLQ